MAVRTSYTIALTSLLVPLFSFPVVANDQDTNLRIQQRDALSAQEKEKRLLQEEKELELQRSKQAQEQSSSDQSNDNLGQALYLAVKGKQWSQVEVLLNQYQSSPYADPLLIHYAQGGLSRYLGRLSDAEAEYRSLLSLYPNFLPAQLELARVLFERKKNQDAHTLFSQIKSTLPTDNPRADGVRRTLNAFISALEHRDAWQGAISFGPTFNDNLNSSSETYTCLVRHETGKCLFDRVTPEKQRAAGLTFNASANKRISFKGHHGMSLQALTYGSRYNNHSEYNEQTANVSFGYSFQDQRHSILIAPLIEYSTYADKSLYWSTGLKLNGFHSLDSKSALRWELKGEYQDYRPTKLDYQSDWQWNASINYWHQLPQQWLAFGGIDWTHKQNDQDVHAYQLYGGRIGVVKSVEGWLDANLFASLRERQYEGYNALLDAKRRDTEQNYTVTFSSPKLVFWTLTPILEWTHKRVNSNVDWLYTYQQNEVSVKFEKRF
ncbi:DUF560 domain-containing protein [Vibrio harveyi]